MASPKQLYQTCIVLALLILTWSGLSAQQSQSFQSEIASVDLDHVEVCWVSGGDSECVFTLQVIAVEGQVLHFVAYWNPSGLGCIPRNLGTLVARLPGQIDFPLAHVRWDGGAILIDLTDF